MSLNIALYSQAGVTIANTEYSLTNNSTTIATKTDKGIIEVWVDIKNMVAGDEYEIALREKVVTSGGTQRKIVIGNPTGLPADNIWKSGPFIVGIGWDVTMTRISATSRAFDWSIRAAQGSTINLGLYSQSTVSISTTEYSLTNNSTTIATKTDKGMMQLILELDKIVDDDEFEVAFLEKVVGAGTQQRVVLANLQDVQSDLLFVTAPVFLGAGWDLTVKRIAGADRTFNWSVRSVT